MGNSPSEWNGTMMFDVHIEIGWRAPVAVGPPEVMAVVGCLAWVSIPWATASGSIATNQGCRIHELYGLGDSVRDLWTHSLVKWTRLGTS